MPDILNGLRRRLKRCREMLATATDPDVIAAYKAEIADCDAELSRLRDAKGNGR